MDVNSLRHSGINRVAGSVYLVYARYDKHDCVVGPSSADLGIHILQLP